MKKIIVVGHPQSGYERIGALLQTCGMAPANPSRREGFTPTQISETLLKMHGRVTVECVRDVRQLSQIQVAPVWRGLALDLMLANMEQPLWGWTDAQAVYLLDFWKQQDPQVVFVLVYERPETALTHMPLEDAAATSEELQGRIDGWSAYNEALLNFHLCNSERSVLVHAGQGQVSIKKTLTHIRARINAPLQLPPNLSAMAEVSAGIKGDNRPVVSLETVESLTAKLSTMRGKEFKAARKRVRVKLQVLRDQKTKSTLVPHEDYTRAPIGDSELVIEKVVDRLQYHALHVREHTNLGEDVIAQLLAKQFLQADCRAIQLYGELEAAATLANTTVALHDGTESDLSCQGISVTYQAWQALVEQRRCLQEQLHEGRLQALKIQELQLHSEQAALQSQERQLKLENLQTVNEQVQVLYQKSQSMVGKLESDLQNARKTAQKSDEESKLLLGQLCKLQEELESNGQQQEQAIGELLKSQSMVGKLESDLQNARKTAQKSDEESKLLLGQLRKLQEELESNYRHGQRQEQAIGELLKSQSMVGKLESDLQNARKTAQKSDEESKLLLGQLSKLHEELESNYRHGQRQEQAIEELLKTKAELKTAKEKINELKPLQALTSKLKIEQERVKALKSYKIKTSQLQKELEVAQREILQFQAKLSQACEPEKTYGNSVHLMQENELLLSQLHKLQGELENYYLDQSKLKNKADALLAMPKPKQKPKAYYGAADRIKQQLTYRLGSTMIAHSRSLGGWLNMPFALWSETKRFKLDRVQQKKAEMPPISLYCDADEAERIKKHLSYRLGKRMLNNSKSLAGWVAMPWSMYSEVRVFRQQNK